MNKNLKTIFAGVIAASLALSLGGCASTSPEALASIETNITSEIQTGYLVGDELKIETNFTAGQPVGGNLELAVEVSVDDGKTWETIFSDSVAGEELTQGIGTEATYAFDAPGTAQFRATVLDDGVVISEMESDSIVVSDLKSLVRSLYYGYSQTRSIKQENKYIRENDFPGAYDMKSSKWKKSERAQIESNNYWGWWKPINAIADLESIAPDPTWKLEAKCTNDWNPPAESRFYIVTVKFDKKKQDVHVGYLDGKLYFFISQCY